MSCNLHAILVFYRCVKNCHKLSGLKNTHVSAHYSVGRKSGQTQLGFLLRILTGWTQTLGKDPLPLSFRLLADTSSFPHGCWFEAPTFLHWLMADGFAPGGLAKSLLQNPVHLSVFKTFNRVSNPCHASDLSDFSCQHQEKTLLFKELMWVDQTLLPTPQ